MKSINTFWNWFQNNEESIKNALLLGLNSEEVFFHLDKNVDYISKRIGYLIKPPTAAQKKYTILFTAAGYRKLFPKIVALEDQSPSLKYFTSQAFIKPIQDPSTCKDGTDLPYIFENHEIKISQLQMALLDYNIDSKQLKIKVYLPNYEAINQQKNADLKLMIMEIIGEIAYRKHIKRIDFASLPPSMKGLLPLIELPDYIDYLYQINSRGTTRLL